MNSLAASKYTWITGCLARGLILAIALPGFSLASTIPPRLSTDTVCEQGVCTAVYEASFFARYAPVTALDMVRNLPGFTLDEGDQTRGFAGGAGNILIDGERVSSKSEPPSEVLSRIPAARVERIEIIRGRTGGTDLRGQSVIANVIRTSGALTGAWRLGANTFHPQGTFYPFASASTTIEQGEAGVTFGIEADRYLGFVEQDEVVLGPDGNLREVRDEAFREDGYSGKLTVEAQAAFGRTIGRLNARYSLFDEAGGETSRRQPVGEPAFTIFQGDTDAQDAYEIGFDLERPLGIDVGAKLIGLHRSADFTETGSLVFVDDAFVDRETAFNSLDTETILRFEFDFRGLERHLIEAAVEGAVNRLDSRFSLLRNVDGVLVPQPVPGAETEVKEERLDTSLSDSFSIGPVAVDLELAAEASTITQTGGFAEDRSFFFFKPGLTLTHTPTEQLQLRLRSRREVSQLDFVDFVSAADLGDDELALGNPDLSPETTIIVEATVERRFGEFGVLSLTGFYNRISDVQDILPLEGRLEVPGNIGDGTRTGVRGTATIPIDGLGISGARLDLTGEWQTSSVVDPLTGESRRLSGERGWEGNIAFRQDIAAWNFAWGGDISVFDDYPLFGLDERDRFNSGADLDAFVETRAVAGLRIRLGVENILRTGTDRKREVFIGPRSDGPFAFVERRDSAGPRQVFVVASGAF